MIRWERSYNKGRMASETEDPRMHEVYMKDEAYERMRKELGQIETVFAKAKDCVFYYPKALHPMAVASKELTQALNQLFPRECVYSKVSTVFSAAFTGIVAVYNDTVHSSMSLGERREGRSEQREQVV